MMTARRFPTPLVVIAASILVSGLTAGMQPRLAIAAAGLVVIVLLTFAAPVANLVAIVFMTAVVPYQLQNEVAGTSSSGLVLSDALLIAGLLRAVFALRWHCLSRAHRGGLTATVAFVAVAIVQFARGVLSGHDPAIAGGELRVLIAFSSFVVALPVLLSSIGRRRLFGWLVVPGLALGAWGLAQWALGLEFGGEFGVREGVDLTAAGKGQLQGGLYGFPVAVVMCLAALTSGHVTSRAMRRALTATGTLNLVCLLLTYERTFWLATMVSSAFVVVRADSPARLRSIRFGFIAAVVALAGLSTLAPGTLSTAGERLLSLGKHEVDNSVRYRLVESRHIIGEINENPILGSALGAEVFWSRPWERVPGRMYHYSHNGYLWLAWKMGLPGALLITGLIAFAIIRRQHSPPDEPLFAAFRRGAQAGLLLLMIANITFPAFNTFGITAVMGLLVAVSLAPPLPPFRENRTITAQTSATPATARSPLGTPSPAPR